MRKFILGMAAIFTATYPALANETTQSSAQDRFDHILSWEGRWHVKETENLQIIFEITARGNTIVERWETSSGLHSITLYHLDGDEIIATHYCPQGNQPRLASDADSEHKITFHFKDVTDLDEGESHTNFLQFTTGEDGTLKRTEIYRGSDGLGAPSTYTLERAPNTD